jgi:hypothetical protein
MVLYLAISGETKDEVIENLIHFLSNRGNLRDKNSMGDYYGPHDRYEVDYEIEAEDKQAQLANLLLDFPKRGKESKPEHPFGPDGPSQEDTDEFMSTLT